VSVTAPRLVRGKRLEELAEKGECIKKPPVRKTREGKSLKKKRECQPRGFFP